MTAICQSSPNRPSTLRHGFFLLVLLFSLGKLQAQKVETALSQDRTAVGQPVQLTIKVVGGRAAQLPQQLNVDGLDARFSGQSNQTEMYNFQVRSVTATYTYRIIALKTGEFTIPSMSFTVGDKPFKTEPLQLTVVGAGTVVAPQASTTAPPQASTSQAPAQAAPAVTGPAPTIPSKDTVAFGQLIVPKKTAYVGEVVPIELRFYYDARFQAETEDHPVFSGEGFTVLKFSKRSERQQQVGDRVFNVYAFQTAITAVKTGPLEIPAATLDSQIVIPTNNQDPNDFFGGLFQRNEVKRGNVATNTEKLDVKALPLDGKPDDFGGAIGLFSIQASASPKKASAGDPISLKVSITGRGNFDAMGAPTLMNDEGWRTYPPGEKFEPSPSDPIGYNGQKQFDYTMMARETQTKTPVAEFTFFDPSIEKYVTLKSSPIAIDAKGGGTPPADTTATAATATPTPAASAAPTSPASTPGPEDSLATQFASGNFQPILFNKAFLIANGAMGVIWLGVLLVGFGRAVSSSTYARESAAHRERRKLLDRMDSTDIDSRLFLTLGAEFVRARLEAIGPVSSLREALEKTPVRSETKAAVASLLDKADELNYAAGSAEAKVGPEERQQIVANLKEFDNELQNAR